MDEVIKLLDMETYSDAVVGVPGEGLNVEQVGIKFTLADCGC